MIKLLHFMLTNLLSENISPKTLQKKSEKNTFEQFCDKAVPYVLLICIALLFILTLVILVKYGSAITGTEANIYYYHNNV